VYIRVAEEGHRHRDFIHWMCGHVAKESIETRVIWYPLIKRVAHFSGSMGDFAVGPLGGLTSRIEILDASSISAIGQSIFDCFAMSCRGCGDWPRQISYLKRHDAIPRDSGGVLQSLLQNCSKPRFPRQFEAIVESTRFPDSYPIICPQGSDDCFDCFGALDRSIPRLESRNRDSLNRVETTAGLQRHRSIDRLLLSLDPIDQSISRIDRSIRSSARPNDGAGEVANCWSIREDHMGVTP
jgi:hypothetical protein